MKIRAAHQTTPDQRTAVDGSSSHRKPGFHRLPPRKRAGQGLVELTVGCVAVAPVALLILDLGVLVLAHTANENLAKTAARARRQRSRLHGSGQCASSQVRR